MNGMPRNIIGYTLSVRRYKEQVEKETTAV